MKTCITYYSKDGWMMSLNFISSEGFNVMSISLVCNISKAKKSSEIPHVNCVHIEGRGMKQVR